MRTSSFLIACAIGITFSFFAPATASATDVEPGQESGDLGPNFVIYDLPADRIESRLGITYEEMLQRRAADSKAVPSDTLKALVFLAEWADDPANAVDHTPDHYDTLLFTQGIVSTGSMREYMLEASYGKLWIEGDVHGWYSQPTYIPNDYFRNFFDAADADIDYSDYDRDGDGYTDAVWIFHAGPGEEETHNPAHIWSFAVSGLNHMTDDGVIIDRFACNPEMHADGSITSIRVAAHEASHVLGLPDLYDYNAKLDTVSYYTPGDANDHPLMDWCLMGYYGYNIFSYGTRQDPAHLCAWSKQELGWVTPTPLSVSQKDVPLPEVTLNPVIYKIVRPGGPGLEYFLLENRNSNSAAIFDHLDSDFSAYWPSFTFGQNQKDPGMLILHVDDAMSGNTSGAHYRVAVEDAGYDPATPWDGTSEFSEEWYPYETRISAPFSADDAGQSSFTPSTVPNTDWYGAGSGIWITNISGSGMTMTFDIGFGNAWPAIVSHSPVALNVMLMPFEVFLFTATAIDEDLDPTTYEWYEDGLLQQTGASNSYSFTAGTSGSSVDLMVVATDGSLADSLTWAIDVDLSTGVAGSTVPSAGPAISASPNPFNPTVAIRVSVPEAGALNVSVHDISGRLVAELADRFSEPGIHELIWDGKEASGNSAPSGIYFVRVNAGAKTALSKIVLLR